jgi:hypothetical protein
VAADHHQRRSATDPRTRWMIDGMEVEPQVSLRLSRPSPLKSRKLRAPPPPPPLRRMTPAGAGVNVDMWCGGAPTTTQKVSSRDALPAQTPRSVGNRMGSTTRAAGTTRPHGARTRRLRPIRQEISTRRRLTGRSATPTADLRPCRGT